MFRSAIIGMGMNTSLGRNLDETWRALLDSKSGISEIADFDSLDLPVSAAGRLQVERDGKHDRDFAAYALRLSVEECIRSAQISETDIKDACFVLAAAPFDHSWQQRAEFQERLCSSSPSQDYSQVLDPDFDSQPFSFLRSVNVSSVWQYLQRKFGFRDQPVFVHTACSSGNSAIQIGQEMIAHGLAKRAFVAAYDTSLSPETITKFFLLGALSNATDTPHNAIRPYSKDRCGFVMSEATACMLLEDEAEARRLGRDVKGWVLGCGERVDVFHRTRSDPEASAIVDAIQNALRDAEIDAGEIDYVNGHGTGTKDNDLTEGLGLQKVFGGRTSEIPVNSTKSALGHSLTASALCEAIISLKTMNEGIIPVSQNYNQPDPDIPLNVIHNEPLVRRADITLSNSFGFGGQNAVVVLGSSRL